MSKEEKSPVQYELKNFSTSDHCLLDEKYLFLLRNRDKENSLSVMDVNTFKSHCELKFESSQPRPFSLRSSNDYIIAGQHGGSWGKAFSHIIDKNSFKTVAKLEASPSSILFVDKNVWFRINEEGDTYYARLDSPLTNVRVCSGAVDIISLDPKRLLVLSSSYLSQFQLDNGEWSCIKKAMLPKKDLFKKLTLINEQQVLLQGKALCVLDLQDFMFGETFGEFWDINFQCEPANILLGSLFFMHKDSFIYLIDLNKNSGHKIICFNELERHHAIQNIKLDYKNKNINVIVSTSQNSHKEFHLKSIGIKKSIPFEDPVELLNGLLYNDLTLLILGYVNNDFGVKLKKEDVEINKTNLAQWAKEEKTLEETKKWREEMEIQRDLDKKKGLIDSQLMKLIRSFHIEIFDSLESYSNMDQAKLDKMNSFLFKLLHSNCKYFDKIWIMIGCLYTHKNIATQQHTTAFFKSYSTSNTLATKLGEVIDSFLTTQLKMELTDKCIDSYMNLYQEYAKENAESACVFKIDQ